MAAGYSKLNNPGMTSLARAEMAILRGQRGEAQAHAAAAERQLPAGTPAWQRAQDIKAYINSRPRRELRRPSIRSDRMRSILLVLCAGLVAVGDRPGGRAARPRRSAWRGGRGRDDRRQGGARQGDPRISDGQSRSAGRGDAGARAQAGQPARRRRPEGDPGEQGELLRDPDSPVAGNPNGDVTIVEFSDYQCPYCKRAHTAVKSVLAADSKVKLVYKDLPILGEPSQASPLSRRSPRASRASTPRSTTP